MTWNKKYKETDLKLIPSKPILSDFGKALDVEDRVEFSIHSADGESLLFSNIDLETYKVAEGGILDDGTINSDSVIFLDIHNDIREYVSSGTFLVKYNFYRTVVGTPGDGVNDLYIDEISASRKEIRLKISGDATQIEQEIFEDFGDKLSIKGDVAHWVDVHVNFGGGIVPLAVNWQLDKVSTSEFPYSIVLKLYDPLPVEITKDAPCWIVQEMITPIQETVFVESPEIELQINMLRPANFTAGSDENLGSGTTGFESFNSLTAAKEGVLNKILNNYFSGSIDSITPVVDYRRFSHFVRFGSAEERITNFRYKLSQMEYYDTQILELQANPHSASYHYLANIDTHKTRKNEIVSNFDNYEKFLYNESASYATSSLGEFYPTTWPKQSAIQYPKSPYICQSVTSSAAMDWYDGAIASASYFDTHNIHSLANTAIPLHIHQDPTIGGEENVNDGYVKFVNMIGQFYDEIYLYISAIPEIWDRHNVIDARLIEGQFSGSDMISKDLLFAGLQSLGYQQCTPADDSDLWAYLLGTDEDGHYGDKTINERIGDWGYWNAPDDMFASASYVEGISPFTQTKIYASDWYQTSHSVALQDVRHEYSKRILNNLPYLMKSKGTLEGLKAYMNIYGVPQSLFKIREATAPPPVDYFANHYYEYDYYNYALSFNGSCALTASWDKIVDPTIKADQNNREQYPDTIEFRYKIPDMLDHKLQCGKLNFEILDNNANKKDMVVVQINSSSFVAVEHASRLPSGSETYNFPTGENSNYGRMTFALGVNDGTYQYPVTYLSCSTDWQPIYDGDWWNCMVRRNAPTATTVPVQIAETFTYDLFCKKASDWSGATISHASSASMTQNGGTTYGKLANHSWNSDGFDDTQYVSSSFYTPENNYSDFSIGYAEGHFGSNYDSFFVGGAVHSTEWGINRTPGILYNNFSGSMQELRFWVKPLSESAFDNHVFSPMAIDGNTYTSSYSDLIARWSLGADLKTYPIITGTKLRSSHPNQDIDRPFSGNRSTYLTSSGFTGLNDYEDQYERVSTIVPNYIGMDSREKIRIEDNELVNGTLSSTKKSSVSARDSAPKDENRITIELTPVDGINIDIEHQLGGIDFNDLVGDPRARYMEYYPDVVYYDSHYWLKHFGPFRYAEFFNLVKYYDGQILCQLRKNVPARSQPNFSITIQPHILERPRFPWRIPDIEHDLIEGKMAARVHLHGATTELGRFKHNGPGDPFYSDWDKRGPLESRYGDLINPSHRFGHRDQAHMLPPIDMSYGFGGQHERERNPLSLYNTTVGELEATIKNDPFAPIILDMGCWERDQHIDARYEFMVPVHWGSSKGSFWNYTVSPQTSTAATAASTELHINGTWPPAAEGYFNSSEIVLTAQDGTITPIIVGDARAAAAASATITFPNPTKTESMDEGIAVIHSASLYLSDTTGSYFEFNGTGSLLQPDGSIVSESVHSLEDYVNDLKTKIHAHVSFSATTGSSGEGFRYIAITQTRAATMPNHQQLADNTTWIDYNSNVLSGSLFHTNMDLPTADEWTSPYVISTSFSGGKTLINAAAGAGITYTATRGTLATRVRTAIHAVSGFTCGTVRNVGDTSIIPVTQSTVGEDGNTHIKGNFFGPWNIYYPEYGYNKNLSRIPGSYLPLGTGAQPFTDGKDITYANNITLVEDTTKTFITQSNPYWDRDVVHIISHPSDPRETERWYDFNKQEYIGSNLFPNKEMSQVNRQVNFPVVNAGLTSYADQRSCRDRGKEWFFPFIGNHRESFYKSRETFRFATELSQSLGKKVPHTQFGQSSIGYGNLIGESIVSHSGAAIQNIAAISVMSRSAQYQDYRAKGIQNLIYDGCIMSASDFNIDSPQTCDGGPIVEIIDTTPFVLTVAEPTLGQGPGIVQGEGSGRGIGKYSGRIVERGVAAGRGQVFNSGEGRRIRYSVRANPGSNSPINQDKAR